MINPAISGISPVFRCICCMKDKPISEAHIGKDGFYTICKLCRADELFLRFKTMCPVQYGRHDPKLMHPTAAARLPYIIEWKYGPKGLLAWGVESGRGKTRCMWLLVRRLMAEDGIDCEGMNAMYFQHRMERMFRQDENVHEWLDRLATVPVLFIDDIGKEKGTERVIAELHWLVEQRCSNGLPILATTNEDSESMVANIKDRTVADKYGPYIVRRIKEFSTAIAFV